MGCAADVRDKHAWPPVQNMTRHRYVRPLRRNLLGREAPRRLCDRHARQISSMLLLRCCAQEKMFPDTHEQNSACRWVCLCVNFDISRRASAAASVYERKNPLRESASRVRFASAPLKGAAGRKAPSDHAALVTGCVAPAADPRPVLLLVRLLPVQLPARSPAAAAGRAAPWPPRASSRIRGG